MDYLEALFLGLDKNSNKTNKLRRKAWEANTWIEAGEHGKMHRIINSRDNWEVYEIDVEVLEDDWAIYHEIESRSLFTAVFDRYEPSTELLKKKTHFRDVRTREGGLVAKELVFDEDISAKIVGHLTIGEYVAFLADVEFKNIEFQYPHNLTEGRNE